MASGRTLQDPLKKSREVNRVKKKLRRSRKICLLAPRFGPHLKNRVSEVTCVKNDAKEKENMATGPTLRVLLKKSCE